MTKSQLVQELQDREDKSIRNANTYAKKKDWSGVNYWEGKHDAYRATLLLIEQVYDSGNW